MLLCYGAAVLLSPPRKALSCCLDRTLVVRREPLGEGESRYYMRKNRRLRFHLVYMFNADELLIEREAENNTRIDRTNKIN